MLIQIVIKTLAYHANHRYTVRVLNKRRYTMTFITNPERTLINAANWCRDYADIPAKECIADIFLHPTVAQIINNWANVVPL
jgi:hypothetical protein